MKYPEWQGPLEELSLELDREKLAEKVQKVENLLTKRLQQLRQVKDSRREEEAIKEALPNLRIIKRDKLGFPDWK